MRKEAINMNYKELKKLKLQLIQKENKTDDEVQLLAELQSLSKIIDTADFSLALSTKVCKTCGKPL